MKAAFWFACLAVAAVAAEPDNAGAPGRRTVEHEGQVFELASSLAGANVETHEYVPVGETLATWTQLVTVQRLTLPGPRTTDEFLAYFEKRVREDGASWEVLRRTASASVFVVRFPASDRNEEQVMICLGMLDPAKATLVNIVQYAIKPQRVPVAAVESRLKSWRDKFLRQVPAGDAGA